MSGNRKEDEMICALTAEEHAALQSGLDALPETMPPRGPWCGFTTSRATPIRRLPRRWGARSAFRNRSCRAPTSDCDRCSK